jgi:competence protein ComEA
MLRVASGQEVRIEEGGLENVGGGSCEASPLPERFRYLLGMKMNINRATREELALLPGIGETLARRIRHAREENKGFSSWDDLHRIPGLGTKRLEKIERQATVGP